MKLCMLRGRGLLFMDRRVLNVLMTVPCGSKAFSLSLSHTRSAFNDSSNSRSVCRVPVSMECNYSVYRMAYVFMSFVQFIHWPSRYAQKLLDTLCNLCTVILPRLHYSICGGFVVLSTSRTTSRHASMLWASCGLSI